MSLITPFDPWKSKLCSCPPKYSLSAYTGCAHGCLYCYASSYIPSFFRPRPKKNFLERLRRELRKLKNHAYITMANSSDPYLPVEKELRLTRASLEIIRAYNLKIMLVTKSDLIIRDLDILQEIKEIVVSFTITTLNETLARRLEPAAPSPKARLEAVRTLAKRLPVVVRLDPLIYPLNTEVKNIKNTIRILKETGAKQIITSSYKAKPDNLKRMINSFPEYKKLWHKLYLIEGEKKGQYIYLPENIRKDLILCVREEVIKNKLVFSSCREEMVQFNTGVCDGSLLFEAKQH